MITVKIVQEYKARWRIEANGHVLQTDITIGNTPEAERYLRNYMTSFFPWTMFNLIAVPLKGRNK